ncbi:acyltransferase family protein, partial [Klebsiella aerogenes]
MAKGSVLTYRPDVDGLRAIAVMSVLLYHAFPTIFRSGYIGVDIFFVISGFLITTIIRKEVISGNFSLLPFYQKRIRRIYPALIITLIGILFLSWFLLSTDEYVVLMNPLMILVKIIKLRWIHILSYDQMVSRKINNQTTR